MRYEKRFSTLSEFYEFLMSFSLDFRDSCLCCLYYKFISFFCSHLWLDFRGVFDVHVGIFGNEKKTHKTHSESNEINQNESSPGFRPTSEAAAVKVSFFCRFKIFFLFFHRRVSWALHDGAFVNFLLATQQISHNNEQLRRRFFTRLFRSILVSSPSNFFKVFIASSNFDNWESAAVEQQENTFLSQMPF